MRALQIATVFLLFFATVTCGYFQAGSWEDDPKNWLRAFGEEKPTEVQVARSLYTRFPHFTHEHVFYFEFKASRDFLEAFIEKLELKRAPILTTQPEFLDRGPDAPEWFLPEPTMFEPWRGTGALENMQLFVKWDSGIAYVTHFQL